MNKTIKALKTVGLSLIILLCLLVLAYIVFASGTFCPPWQTCVAVIR